MRLVQTSFWSFLALVVLPCVTLAGRYEGLFEVVPAYDAPFVQDGTLPKILAEVLQGRHHPLPFEPFPHAQVAAHDKDFRSFQQDELIDTLRESGDYNNIFVLGALFPRVDSRKGLAAAMLIGYHPDNPNTHTFAFISAEHFEDRMPKVHLTGFGLGSNARYLKDVLRSHPPPSRDADLEIGHIVTTKELFAALPRAVRSQAPSHTMIRRVGWKTAELRQDEYP